MDAVEEIKKRLDIEEVVGDYVELKRSGRNLKALSPFTSEKTASFMVSPEKQIWHDFSSNKGGDMFSFVMELEGLDFKGALDLLARKAGVDLSLYQKAGGGNAKHKERLFSLLESATLFYQHSLLKNDRPLKYLREERGYSKETIANFRFGYSPQSGRALNEFLKKKGFSETEMKDAGVVSQRRTGVNDMFRGRVMIPLSDGQGRIVGFTARILESDPSAPKYINTPSTLIYDKGRQLFGLHMAKQAIRNSGFVVVVEGNLDVVASHQAGVQNVVAVAGTALTMDHLKSVSRLTDDVRFAFDQDRAGVAATERAIPLAQSLGLRLSIITVPSGKDPDELIKEDPNKWRQVTEKSQYGMDWVVGFYQKQHDISTAEGKTRFSNIVLKAIKRLEDPVEKEHYLKQLSKLLDISEQTLQKKLLADNKEAKPKKRIQKQPAIEKPDDLEMLIIQDQLLGLLFNTPRLREYAQRISEDDFIATERKELVRLLQKHPGPNETLSKEDLYNIESYVKIVSFKAEELYRKFSREQEEEEISALINKLKTDKKSLRQKQLTQAIKKAEQEGDVEAINKLVVEWQSLLKKD